MNKAFKFRIYPNSEQQILLAKTFGCTRFIYNKMLGEKIAHYEEFGNNLRTTPEVTPKNCTSFRVSENMINYQKGAGENGKTKLYSGANHREVA